MVVGSSTFTPKHLSSALLLLLISSFSNAFSPVTITERRMLKAAVQNENMRSCIILSSSFYDDFEKFDEDEDDDDDLEDDEEEIDDAAIADFRSRMGSLFGEEEVKDDDDTTKSDTMTVDDLISFATGSTSEKDKSDTEWAKATEKLEGGVVLLANPAKFCTDFGTNKNHPNPALLQKFGLTLPPPADLGPDRRADLLPVLTLLERHPLKGSQAVLLNRRTGYLLGDLEQPAEEGEGDSSSDMPPAPPKLGAFMIQPLWFGGTSASETNSQGLDMLHLCPTVVGAKQLTEDGLFWGGDPAQAQEAMTDPSLERIMSGFDFKFFVQSTKWFPLQLEKEVRDGTWFVASVSKDVLFKSRDRMGTRRAKPLWTEVMELMGGEYEQVRNQLYGEND